MTREAFRRIVADGAKLRLRTSELESTPALWAFGRRRRNTRLAAEILTRDGRNLIVCPDCYADGETYRETTEVDPGIVCEICGFEIEEPRDPKPSTRKDTTRCK